MNSSEDPTAFREFLRLTNGRKISESFSIPVFALEKSLKQRKTKTSSGRKMFQMTQKSPLKSLKKSFRKAHLESVRKTSPFRYLGMYNVYRHTTPRDLIRNTRQQRRRTFTRITKFFVHFNSTEVRQQCQSSLV